MFSGQGIHAPRSQRVQIKRGMLVLLWVLIGNCCVADDLATVNGQAISTGEFHFFLDQVPEAERERAQQRVLQNVIDRHLIADFLRRRKFTADPVRLEHQLLVIRKGIEQSGDSYEAVLQRLKLSEEELKNLLALQLAWDAYAARQNESKLQAYFAEHREEFDGTRVAARHIVRTVGGDANETEWTSAESLLTDVAEKIRSGELTFAAAAERYSQSPSAKKGGEIGLIEYSGQVAAEVAQVAFSLEPGAVSSPVRSRFGVHLVTITERVPGQLSLEDARPQLLKILSQQLWEEQAAALRKTARIRILSE